MNSDIASDATRISGGRSDDEAIVVLDGVRKQFKDFVALKNVNFRVGKQEVVVIIGPSGSGKSTLIRCINRLEEHDEGRIFVDGTELTTDIRNIEEIRRETGMVFRVSISFRISRCCRMWPSGRDKSERCQEPRRRNWRANFLIG